MMTKRPSGERGFFDHGWLKTFHSFSFGEYDDPRYRQFKALRVLNEDVVGPNTGFPPHPHRDMEIVTYILSGALEHRDSLGNTSILEKGAVQRMTAGKGIVHSERNPSATEPVHLIQIWLMPRSRGLTPGYEEKSALNLGDGLTLMASEDGRLGSLLIHQDVNLSIGRLPMNASIAPPLPRGRAAWVQVVQGDLEVGKEALSQGDGLAIVDEPSLAIRATAPAEFLLFDMPA